MLSSSASLTEALVLSANLLANKAREITSQRGPGGYPKVIPEGITVGNAVVTETGGSIDIYTEDKNEGNNVLMTLVFELGAKPHEITPRREGYPLRIPRERWPKYQPPPDVDPLFFMRVEHPGMQPRPFLMMALMDVLPQISEIIADSFMVNIPMHDKQIEVIR